MDRRNFLRNALGIGAAAAIAPSMVWPFRKIFLPSAREVAEYADYANFPESFREMYTIHASFSGAIYPGDVIEITGTSGADRGVWEVLDKLGPQNVSEWYTRLDKPVKELGYVLGETVPQSGLVIARITDRRSKEVARFEGSVTPASVARDRGLA